MGISVRAAGPVLAAWLALAAGAAPAPGADLNVLLVTIDTLRPDRLGCYGSPYLKTPQIDRLAGTGVVFERAFAHNPETLPSHTNILLGLLPLAHGVSENSKSVLAPDFLTMAELFKARGYATGAFVGAFTLDSRFGLDQGFDLYDDRFPIWGEPGEMIAERRAEETVSAALDWLSAPKRRWLCWIHLWDPHEPYRPPEPFLSEFKDDPYSGEVAYVDAQLGRLLAEMGRRRLLDKTLVVLTGDHGESLGQHGELTHGYFAYNATLWVPLIIAGPGLEPARIKDAVGHVDIFPTVCDLAGPPKPAGLQGESLAPLLRGRPRPARPIYFEALEAYLNRGWAPLRGLIENGTKYIDTPIPELYDLGGDFDEAKNLAGGVDLAPFRQRLRALMKSGALPLAAKSGRRATDRETLAGLRSLGYVAAQVTQLKPSYGPGDDLKTLLPLEQKAAVAELFRKQGRVAESVRLLEDILKERRDFIKAYDRLYEIYRSQGLVDDALQVYERGFAANPGSYAILSGYGIALVMNGRFEKGAEVLERALGLYDQDAGVWNSLGVAYGNMGRPERAREDFGRALALVPDDPVFNENAGMFHLDAASKTGDAAEAGRAAAFFERAVAADPDRASALNGLAGAQRILGRADEALANWEKAVAAAPDFPLPLFNLALAYLERGRKAEALAACEKFLLLRGGNISARELEEVRTVIEKCKGPAGGREELY